MVVLLSDGYIEFRKGAKTENEVAAKRFFQICRKLPQEIQMVLINRIYFLPENFFLSHRTELALKRVLSSPLLQGFFIKSSYTTRNKAKEPNET